MYENIDTILYCTQPIAIDEAWDDKRMNAGGPMTAGRDVKWGFIKNTQASSFRYGGSLKSLLRMDTGWGVEVFDYGEEIVVRMSYSSVATGKGGSKTFLIVFDPQGKGKGVIKSSVAKVRSISDISQAASYIKNCASSIKSMADSGS